MINQIHNEDCLTTLSKIKDNSIDLVITSPPYNKNYYSPKNKSKNDSSLRRIMYDSYEDSMSPEEYEQWQCKIISECIRIIKDDGSIFYNHQDIQKNHNTIHPHFVYKFPLKQLLIWDRLATPKLDSNYFYPSFEYIFWLKKTPDSKVKFNKNNMIYKNSIIRLVADKNNPHPAPFPLQLPNNFILGCTNEGDIVYDPFMGSGTTAIAALMNNRNFIGSEISKSYIDMANKKINNFKNQTTLF
jgi:modification methylase